MTEQDKQALIKHFCERDCGDAAENCTIMPCHEIELIQEFPTTEADSDTISRAKAIEALVAETIYTEEELREYYEANSHRNEWVNGIYEAVEVIKQLPPAQPEIVRCKDCKHFVRDDIEEYTPYGFYNAYFRAFCDKHWDNEQGEFIDAKLDDFCSFAERREVTE